MKGQRFRSFFVAKLVYVSSSFHYHFDVAFKEHGEAFSEHGFTHYRTYAFGVFNPMDRQYPKYVERAVEEKILELLKSGAATFHEYDRDGIMRFEDLRYYDGEEVKRMIRVLERRLNNGAS